MELKTYLTSLWRRKWVIIITTILTLTVVVIGTLLATPTYEASTTLRLATAKRGSVDWVDYDVTYADRLMNTYAKLIATGPVQKELEERLGLDEAPPVTVEIPANTELLKITVEDPHPAIARDAANILAEILIAQGQELYARGRQSGQDLLGQQVAQLEDELSQARKEYEDLVVKSPEDSERISAALRSIELKEATYARLLELYDQARIRDSIQANVPSVVEPAEIPKVPSKPRAKLNVAIGLLVGLIAGVGLAFLFENLDTRLYTRGQIEHVTQLPTLGIIPYDRKHLQAGFLNGRTPQREAFHHLRTNILTLDATAHLQSLMVASAHPREGKSTVAAGLAVAIAQMGYRILLVDGNLRQPTLHEIFNLPNEKGLSSVLRREATLEEAMQFREIPGINLLTSGPLPPNPVELLSSRQMTDLIEQMAQRFDRVLLDTPALLMVADASVLAPKVDGVVLVVGRAQAQVDAVRAARQQLSTIKANSIGVVVNRADKDHMYRHHYSPQISAASVSQDNSDGSE